MQYMSGGYHYGEVGVGFLNLECELHGDLIVVGKFQLHGLFLPFLDGAEYHALEVHVESVAEFVAEVFLDGVLAGFYVALYPNAVEFFAVAHQGYLFAEVSGTVVGVECHGHNACLAGLDGLLGDVGMDASASGACI